MRSTLVSNKNKKTKKQKNKQKNKQTHTQDPEYWKTVHMGGDGKEKEDAERKALEKVCLYVCVCVC